MHGTSGALGGLRKEILEFMRSCEGLLSISPPDTLTQDELDIVRHYLLWLSDRWTPPDAHWSPGGADR